MQKLNFTVDIRAPREKIWQVLWDDATYRQWTRVFSEGSYAVTDWRQGSRVQFLDGQGGGMYSIIDEARPNERMAIRHLGDIKDGVEQPEAAWSGSQEIYNLSSTGEGTRLSVDIDSDEQFAGWFQENFPKALEKVKELAEAA